MVGNSIISAHQDKSSVSVEGKKTEYDVVGGSLSSSEVPGGFFDPTSPTIDAGIGVHLPAQVLSTITTALLSSDASTIHTPAVTCCK